MTALNLFVYICGALLFSVKDGPMFGFTTTFSGNICVRMFGDGTPVRAI
jgi:hypothetical protein